MNERRLTTRRHRATTAGALGLPAALVVLLAFQGGGFGSKATAIGALAACAAAAVLVVLDPTRSMRLSRGAAVAGGALLGLAVWTFASGSWSGADATALTESSRTLLYFVVFIVVAAIPTAVPRMPWLVRTVALALATVCLVGLTTRLFPDVLPVAGGTGVERLSFPIGYWNAFGLAAAVAIVLTLHLAASNAEARVVRILAAAVLPPLAAAVYLTLSRGSIVAVAVGALVYAVLARERGLGSALVAAGPPMVVAIGAAYESDLLTSIQPTTSAAAEQGHALAVVLLLCGVAAAVVRFCVAPLDDWLRRFSPSRRVRRGGAGLLAGVLLVVVAAGLAAGGRTELQERYDDFTGNASVPYTGDSRDRLASVGNSYRLDLWRSALHAFDDQPVHGIGAGAFARYWERDRPIGLTATDAHSLYFETLGELGIVGFALLLVVLGSMAVGLLTRIRGPERSTHAAAFAAVLVWAVHASFDWDWENPAVSVWVFAFGAAALARRGSDTSPEIPHAAVGSVRRRRLGAAATCLVLAVLCVPLVAVVRFDRDLAAARFAYSAQRCPDAIDQAEDASRELGSAPEPYAIVGLCTAARDAPAALAAYAKAIARDPANWRWRWGKAVVLGATGGDPRADLSAARARNPREVGVLLEASTFNPSRRAGWVSAFRAVQVPTP